jgi:hypothetical protein
VNEGYIRELAASIGLKPRDIRQAALIADEAERRAAREAKRAMERAKSQAKEDAIKAKTRRYVERAAWVLVQRDLEVLHRSPEWTAVHDPVRGMRYDDMPEDVIKRLDAMDRAVLDRYELPK